MHILVTSIFETLITYFLRSCLIFVSPTSSLITKYKYFLWSSTLIFDPKLPYFDPPKRRNSQTVLMQACRSQGWWGCQIFTDQLTLSQPRGTDNAHQIPTGTPGFLDLPTAPVILLCFGITQVILLWLILRNTVQSRFSDTFGLQKLSLNRMILCSKLKNGHCKIVTKSQVIT